MNVPSVPRFFKQLQIGDPISIAGEDNLSRIAALRNMVGNVDNHHSGQPRHGKKIAQTMRSADDLSFATGFAIPGSGEKPGERSVCPQVLPESITSGKDAAFVPKLVCTFSFTLKIIVVGGRMRRFYYGLCGLIVTLCSVNVQAQWVPVTSNVRLTHEVLKDGKLLTQQVKEGAFYRTEKGSTLTHWTRGDLDSNRGSGELFDNEKLLRYEIFYEAKKMVEEPSGLSSPRRPDSDMELKPTGSDSVEGIQCDIIVVEFSGPKMKKQPVGSACVVRDLSIMLKQETTYTKPDGTTVHTLWEMHDVKLNVAPDKNEFAILNTFTVMKKADHKPIPMPE